MYLVDLPAAQVRLAPTLRIIHDNGKLCISHKFEDLYGWFTFFIYRFHFCMILTALNQYS